MAKYDWTTLKAEYISGEYKSLREFAEIKCIPYKTLEARATGWVKEKQEKDREKAGKIIEGTIEREVQYAIDRNAAHLAAGDLILTQLSHAVQELKVKDKGVLYLLNQAAATLEKVQKVHRLGGGMSNDEGVTIIDDTKETADDT